MNRLWVRLTLAFALVILVTVGVIALLADLTAGQVFRQYLSYSDIAQFQNLKDHLAEYYVENGGWQGVEGFLRQVKIVPAPMSGQMPGRRPGTIAWGDNRFFLILADAEGQVVSDGPRGQPGRELSRDEEAAAQEILVGDTVVGQLVVVRPMQSAIFGPLERAFVTRLRWLLIAGALLAGALGVLLGVVLSRSLTAPLRRLATAARAVADRDFSRRVRVEGSIEMAEVAEAFNEMTEALESSERQRQNMVADVAHELRTPLSVVQGNLQAILDDVYPLDKTEISRLYDETRLLSRLVDDLRELALADAGQLRLSLSPIDVAPEIQATAEGLALAAEAQRVTLSADIPDGLPPVQADPDRLAQVLRNLLVNAMRHTPAGGSVTVTAAQSGSEVEIAVADTGEGIAPQDLAKVFERFWRADLARARSGRPRPGSGDVRWAGCSGLGLSVAQSLVEAQGGRIWVESTLGEGTTFRFTLPVAKR
ncbi:MAG: ATP-binding protein [Anaerolineae bacterium]|jgi:two-component system OmpR family sensor kinase/two-component system sensor histidine kinase BaeS